MTNPSLAARLLVIFAEELDEQLAQMRGDLDALATDPTDRERVLGLFRVMHTLKGASRAAGVPPIEQLCHELEGGLARARDQAGGLEEGQLTLLIEAADALAGARELMVAGESPASPAMAAVLQHARRGVSAPRSTGPVPPAPADTGSVAATEPVAVTQPDEAAASASPAVSAPPAEAAELDDRRTADASFGRADSVRVAMPQVDALVGAAGEISVLSAALIDRAMDSASLRGRLRDQLRRLETDEARELERDLAALARHAGDDARTLTSISSRLDDVVRTVRQRPLRDLTATVERVARDLARELGKKLRVSSTGTEIEADRVVVDALREPLLHLVRNAVDHGIGSAEERERAGKPAEGAVTLAITLRGDWLRLTLSDDGRGLDLKAIRGAIERGGGAVPHDPMEVMQAIFSDGLSTREAVTSVSGRGIGLGIVRSAVERTGGTVVVHSSPGQGTSFVIDVPLSISTMRAVVVRLGEHLIALPSAFVKRVRRVSTRALARVEGRDVMIGDGAPVPLLPLSALLGAPFASDAWGDRIQVVMLEGGGQRLAVAVDDLEDERELVLRPLEHVEHDTMELAVGTALTGRGGVVLVVSVPTLLSQAGRRAATAPSFLTPAMSAPVVRSRVLVVDDSITSRTLEQSVLAAAGYDVTTAVDGLDGWRAIERGEFDLVVSDVEMPRLDGIGLCERIRATPRVATLPVILVTSLDEPAHRARGLEAGADAYVAKSSFDQDVLLETVRMLIGRQVEAAR